MATFLYANVSTAEETIAVQRAQAEQAGFVIDEVVAEQGTSGLSTSLAERQQGKRLFELLRGGDTLVVTWVDRLGRSTEDVCDTIRAFMRRGVVIKTVINAFTFDGATQDPVQRAVRDAVIGFMLASAAAQAEATKSAQRAGIAQAKQNNERAYLGRKPSFTRSMFLVVRDMLEQSVPIAQIAKDTGLSRQAIYRIKDDPVGCEAALARWTMQRQADLRPIAERLAELGVNF
jgi:putative DNA-invertase from lambdoid prophage Rac